MTLASSLSDGHARRARDQRQTLAQRVLSGAASVFHFSSPLQHNEYGFVV